jgi:imidazole glycerol-phosphate synthase subunit HisH
MNIVIIKYNAGNIQSVLFALERIGVQATVTDEPDLIRTADKVIFPGVGEASTAMNYLKEKKMDELIVSLKQPVLGICLGMQLMCSHSEENNTDCLNIFENVRVRKFKPVEARFKVPQIGWNTIYDLRSNIFNGIAENSYSYFVHSYYAEQSSYSIARTDYVQPYSSAIQKDNFFGVQFHPEKSATVGEQILKNFLTI